MKMNDNGDNNNTFTDVGDPFSVNESDNDNDLNEVDEGSFRFSCFDVWNYRGMNVSCVVSA